MSMVTVASPLNETAVSGYSVPGRVHVRERVTEKVVREAAAVTIGVSRDHVSVDVSEWGGGLAVRVAAMLPIPDLGDTEAIRTATPIIDRVRALQTELGEEFARLTGREVRRVSFTVTGALVPERKRVR